MALARVKVWVAGEILTAADLNGEFNNILNNPTALISPFTANLNANGKQITSLALENLGASPAASVAGRIWFNTATTVKQVEVDDGAFIRTVPSVLATSLTPGDILYALAGSSQGGNPAWTRLGNAATSALGSPLVSGSSGPLWAAPGSGIGSGFAQAWVTFNGLTATTSAASTGGITGSFNVATVQKLSTGVYQIAWSNQFTSATNYALIPGASLTTAGVSLSVSVTTSGNSTGLGTVITRRGSDGSVADAFIVSVLAYGPV